MNSLVLLLRLLLRTTWHHRPGVSHTNWRERRQRKGRLRPPVANGDCPTTKATKDEALHSMTYVWARKSRVSYAHKRPRVRGRANGHTTSCFPRLCSLFPCSCLSARGVSPGRVEGKICCALKTFVVLGRLLSLLLFNRPSFEIDT